MARIVGKSCSIGLLIDDTREKLRGRSYDLVAGADVFRQGNLTRRDRPSARRWPDRVGPRAARRPAHLTTYITTKAFLLEFGLATLRDLPDFEALEDAGLLSREKLLAGEVPIGLAREDDDEDVAKDEVL